MNRELRLFLCGDVMTGRAIDQLMARSVDPTLFEPDCKSALDYLKLAEKRNGPISRPAHFDYIWGDALQEWRRHPADLRIINLETAVTTSDERWDKLVNYRMHPANLGCLQAARVDCCVLANNHVLDWGQRGLLETLGVLRPAMQVAGAGENLQQAGAPAILKTGGRRLLVFSAGVESSGIPSDWNASDNQPGVWRLADLSPDSARQIARHIAGYRSAGDTVLFSIHWGANWVRRVPRLHRKFARSLIDSGAVDLIHGHSSHHPMGLEVYKDKLILYGCGDFINDYEGIAHYQEYRSDLCLMYFPVLGADGKLLRCTMVPLQMRKLSLHRAGAADSAWLRRTISRNSPLLTRLKPDASGDLQLHW